MKTWPAILTFAIRVCRLRFEAMERLTLPGPVPEAPEVIVSHAASEVAVQMHPLGALTEAIPFAFPLETDVNGKITEYVHTMFPACVTVKV